MTTAIARPRLAAVLLALAADAGWQTPDDPMITFHFSATASLDEIKLQVDASRHGGVFAPRTVADGPGHQRRLRHGQPARRDARR